MICSEVFKVLKKLNIRSILTNLIYSKRSHSYALMIYIIMWTLFNKSATSLLHEPWVIDFVYWYRSLM